MRSLPISVSKLKNFEQFEAAIEEIRGSSNQLGDPFNEALEYANTPEEIQRLGGNDCIAEQIISRVQGTPKGTTCATFLKGVNDSPPTFYKPSQK
nr:hypothetical protein [Halomonas sp. UBA3074]